MTRRTLLGGALSGLLLAAGCRPSSRRSAGDPRANVVLIVLDTLRADHLGCYGYAEQTSPCLDRLAQESLIFDRCYAPSSWTVPSMFSMLSGTWPSEHGVYIMRQAFPEHLPWGPELFRRAGYRTSLVLGNGILSPALKCGFDRGFDDVDASACPLKEGSSRTDRITELALSQIDRLPSLAPALLVIHYLDPHGPYTNAPPAYHASPPTAADEARYVRAARSRNSVLGRIPWYQFDPGSHPQAVSEYIRNYDSEIRFVDHCCGRILDALRASGLWEDTVVAVVSDHGDSLGENSYYFLHNLLLYEGLLRVPLILRIPGVEPRRIERFTEGIELLPSLYRLCASDDEPERWQARSVLLEETAKDAALSELKSVRHPLTGLARSLRKGSLHLIHDTQVHSFRCNNVFLSVPPLRCLPYATPPDEGVLRHVEADGAVTLVTCSHTLVRRGSGALRLRVETQPPAPGTLVIENRASARRIVLEHDAAASVLEVPTDQLDDGIHELRVQGPDGTTAGSCLEFAVVADTPHKPGRRLNLELFALEPPTVAPDEALLCSSLWRADSRFQKQTVVALEFRDATGAVAWRDEHTIGSDILGIRDNKEAQRIPRGARLEEHRWLVVPASVAPGTYEAWLSLYDQEALQASTEASRSLKPAVSVGRVEVSAAEARDSVKRFTTDPAESVHALFADRIALRGMEAARGRQPSSFYLTLHWRALAHVPRVVSAAVNLAHGKYQQRSSFALGGSGRYPTTLWTPGETVTETYEIHVNDEHFQKVMKAGKRLELDLTLFLFDTFDRLNFERRLHNRLPVREPGGSLVDAGASEVHLAAIDLGDLPQPERDFLAHKLESPLFYELYDLDADPQERVNLSSRDPERFEMMRRALWTHVAENVHARAADTDAETELDGRELDAEEAEMLRRLRSLGYVR